MLEDQREDYNVTLEDGSEVCYIIRGLDEEELRPWAEFCASVFAYKANPPSGTYFERHYINDPYRENASLIRVALFDGEIVASCRLFLRTLSSGEGEGGNDLSAGGIGEVCTANKHRRRGLSKVLLNNVIAIMKERKLQVSLLHAAPSVFPVYEKAGGYSCSQSCWSAVQVDVESLLTGVTNDIPDTIVRQAKFPEDTGSLSKMHQIYSERRFAGCIVRSEDYWNHYLSRELGDSLMILAQGDDKLLAWLSLRQRGDRMQLREFGLDESKITTSKALSVLLSAAIKQSSTKENFALVLPTYVFETATKDPDEVSYLQLHTSTSEDDHGWMYKILDDKVDFQSINGSGQPHLIWPADSF
jgi:hypothetical protein